MEVLKLMFSILVIAGFLISFGNSREQKKAGQKKVVKPVIHYRVEPGTVDDIINDAAKTWGVHPAVLHAVAEIESSKNIKVGAVTEPDKTRSYGLFQINDSLATDERVKPKELIDDVELNAHIGAKKLGHYCKARIKKEKTLKGKLDAAYGCYRGAKKDEKLYKQLKKSGKLKTIDNVLGDL